MLQREEKGMKRSVFNCAGFLLVFLFVLLSLACPVSASGEQVYKSEEVIYATGFEAGPGDWSAEDGLWEVGSLAAGPGSCYEGAQCAGTRTGPSVGRLVSPPLVLPSVAGDEEIHLHFRHWYSYGPDYQGSGTVEISHFDCQTDGWSQWEALGDSFIGKSTLWSPEDVDLTAYNGKAVRIAFKSDSGNRDDSCWHVDAVEMRKSGNDPAAEGAAAVRPTVTSFKINNGAATTTRRRVFLNNTTTGTPTRYKASESPTFAGATWHPYSRNPSFTLGAGAGTKTVYFRVRNAAGQSTVKQDTIKLTNPLGGTWTGRWTSDYGADSGSLKLVATQTATGYTGKLTVGNTECGTFSNLPAKLTLSGNTVTCTAASSCAGQPIQLKFTEGVLSGNTINGYYNIYVGGSHYDSGTFRLSK